jgi:hypothetical protein
MENNEKQLDEQTKPEAANEGSLSDADLEQVAGGSGLGTRTGSDPFIFRRS